MDKRAIFTMCLQASGLTAKEFAAREGVSENFLHMFLNGERKSARLQSRVRIFIKQNLPLVRSCVEEAAETYGLAA